MAEVVQTGHGGRDVGRDAWADHRGAVLHAVLEGRKMSGTVNENRADVHKTIDFYQGLMEFPLTELFENRDYQGSTHFFFDIGNGNLLAFFDFPGLGLEPVPPGHLAVAGARCGGRPGRRVGARRALAPRVAHAGAVVVHRARRGRCRHDLLRQGPHPQRDRLELADGSERPGAA